MCGSENHRLFLQEAMQENQEFTMVRSTAQLLEVRPEAVQEKIKSSRTAEKPIPKSMRLTCMRCSD